MPRRKVNPTCEIARVIAELKECSFGDILKNTGLGEPTISRHLKMMEERRLISSRVSEKDKRKILYSFNPEELCVITVDDVLKAVKSELEKISEELEEDEERALRDLLIKEIRKKVVENYLKKEQYKREDPVSFILKALSSLICIRMGLSLLKENYDDLSKEDVRKLISELSSTFRRINAKINAQQIDEIYELVEVAEKIPQTFAEKWVRTEFFENSEVYKTINMMFLGMLFSKDFTRLMKELVKKEKDRNNN